MRQPKPIRLALAAAMVSGGAAAADLAQIGTIVVPGAPLANFDVSFCDPADGRYYLADRSNKAVDVIDAKAGTFLTRLGGFIGAVMKDGKVDNAVSGPDGVVVADGAVWAGDGDSTVKVIDPVAGATLATISTGGKGRLDEVAYDPKDRMFIGVNNADEPPFATLISTRPDHRIIGKLVFADATDGAEQPAYNAEDGMFYMAVPELAKDPRRGGVAVIDPRSGTLARMLPVADCHPTGLAFGPGGNFVLGCSANGKTMPAVTVIMNAATGRAVATVTGLGGTDMVSYNARNGQYYTASRADPAGPTLGVIDATTNTLVQKIPIAGGYPHSVASCEANGHVFVPVGALAGGDGTIHVYAPKP